MATTETPTETQPFVGEPGSCLIAHRLEEVVREDPVHDKVHRGLRGRKGVLGIKAQDLDTGNLGIIPTTATGSLSLPSSASVSYRSNGGPCQCGAGVYKVL